MGALLCSHGGGCMSQKSGEDDTEPGIVRPVPPPASPGSDPETTLVPPGGPEPDPQIGGEWNGELNQS